MEGPPNRALNVLSRHAIAAAALTGAARLGARLAPGCAHRLDPAEPTLYLTFDDGPHPRTTAALLEALARHDAGASFFLTGASVGRDPGLARAVLAAGHTVGQHGHAHLDAWRARSRTVIDDLERATGLLEDVLGEPVSWMRPPYGHLTPPVQHWARARGQRVALWDVMPGDFLRSATAAAVARHVRRAARSGSIVALHENDRSADVAVGAVSELLASPTLQRFRFERL